MASTDATSGLVEEVTPLPSGLSRLAASSPLKVSVVTSSVMDLPLKGSRVISPLPQAFGDTESLPARTSVVGFSTSIPSNSEELGPQILRTATNPNPMPETDQVLLSSMYSHRFLSVINCMNIFSSSCHNAYIIGSEGQENEKTRLNQPI